MTAWSRVRIMGRDWRGVNPRIKTWTPEKKQKQHVCVVKTFILTFFLNYLQYMSGWTVFRGNNTFLTQGGMRQSWTVGLIPMFQIQMWLTIDAKTDVSHIKNNWVLFESSVYEWSYVKRELFVHFKISIGWIRDLLGATFYVHSMTELMMRSWECSLPQDTCCYRNK